ncbi:hypothetical protein [Reichenbachiella versicolor]|uniref:hypothetical protein n=1 Tax=Reichenbachiella versicolor TaxID=1821036 RepID=UPI000D6E9547|nr:hypothetical protein [Reichenbachiella versicolor]
MAKRITYDERAKRLARTIEIAEEVINTSTSFPNDLKSHILNFGAECKRLALNPELQFRKVESLKFLENDYLTYWNESDGEHIEQFWKQVFYEELDFERKDIIRIVLKRGRIKDIHEFDNITDNIVAAEQIGRINSEQAELLGNYLSEFESRSSNK